MGRGASRLTEEGVYWRLRAFEDADRCGTPAAFLLAFPRLLSMRWAYGIRPRKGLCSPRCSDRRVSDGGEAPGGKNASEEEQEEFNGRSLAVSELWLMSDASSHRPTKVLYGRHGPQE